MKNSVLWKCGEDKTNKFGSSWKIHSYAATAFFAGCSIELKGKDEYPGIYLTSMQLKNLNLRATLRPLCDLKKFIAVKESSSQLAGIVKIFYNNQVVEAAVYPISYDPYPRSAILMNTALYQQLPNLQIGNCLQICSRFDVEDYKAAESLQSEPKLEQVPLYPDKNWLDLFRNRPEVKAIFPEGFRNNMDDKLLLASLLEQLTKEDASLQGSV